MSKDLFHRAILQSGAPYKDDSFSVRNSQFLNKSKQFAENIGCKGENWIQCLKQLDAAELLKNDSMSISEIIKDEFYKQTGKEALKNGKFHSNIEIMTGIVRNEGDPLASEFISDEKSVTKDQLKEYIERNFQEYDTESIYEFYIENQDESDQNSLKSSFASIYGDSMLVCPTYFFAQDFAKWSKNNKVYFYEIDEKLTKKSKSDTCSENWMGVCHYEDVPIVFGQAVLNQTEFQRKDVEFSEIVMTLWGNFIKHGNPVKKLSKHGNALKKLRKNGIPIRKLRKMTWPVIQKKQNWVKHLDLERENFTNELNPYFERCEKFWRPCF